MDSYSHRGLRKKLIQELEKKGIKNKKILSAMAMIPRHLFLDTAFEEQAYKNKAFPIGNEQTISHPYTVARQTELINPHPTDKILEIGTGSGYQASLLSLLCRRIYSIERHKSLHQITTVLLQKLGYGSVRTLYGDGYKGAPRYAPFDKILVTAGAETVPQELLTQLKVGGVLVIPVGSGDDKTMLRITKIDESKYNKESFGIYQFVPFLGGVSTN